MTEHLTVPRNAEEIVQLEAAGAQGLAAMARGALMQGQMPPRDVLAWYGKFLVAMLIAFEDTSQKEGANMSQEQLEHLSKSMETCVVELSDLVRHLGSSKQFVLHEQVTSALRARLLFLPTTFDASYGGMLPT